MRQTKKILILLLLITAMLSAFSLKEEGSSRMTAMGNAAIMLHDSLDTAFINPAGLVRDRDSRLDFLYTLNNTFRMDSCYSHYLAVQAPDLNIGSLSFYPGLLMNFESYNSAVDGTPLSRELDTALVIGLPAFRMLRGGMSFHIKNAFIKGDVNQSDFRFIYRAGIIYDINKILRAALTLATPEDSEVHFWENIKLGLGAEIDSAGIILSSYIRLVSSYQRDRDLSLDFAAGLEKTFGEYIALRVGVYRQRITVGAGFQAGGIRLDYAFHAMMAGDHRVSLGYRF